MDLDDIAKLKEEITELKRKIGLLMSEIISLTLELHKERKKRECLYNHLNRDSEYEDIEEDNDFIIGK